MSIQFKFLKKAIVLLFLEFLEWGSFPFQEFLMRFRFIPFLDYWLAIFA